MIRLTKPPASTTLDQLGSGGLATTYHGKDTCLGHQVALKMLESLLMRDEAFAERFLSGHPDCTLGDLHNSFDCSEVVLCICPKLLPSPNCIERLRTYPKSPTTIPTDIANVPS